MAPQNLVKVIVAPAVAAFCMVGVVWLQLPRLNTKPELSRAEYIRQEQSQKTGVEVLKQLPSFGFDNLIADRAYLDFIQYYGDPPAREQTGYSLIPEYFEIVVNHDPRFVKAILFLSPATSIYGGRPDRTVAYLEQSLESLIPTFPDAYYVWLYKGVDEMLFTGDRKAARHSHEMASKWASTHDDPQSQAIATRTRETGQFLARNPDSKRAQISGWIMVLANAVDDAGRQLAISRIQALGGKVSVTPQGEVKVQPPKED